MIGPDIVDSRRGSMRSWVRREEGGRGQAGCSEQAAPSLQD